MRRKVSTTVYLTPAQDVALRRFTTRTNIPTAVVIRLSVDIVLAAARHFPKDAAGLIDRLEADIRRLNGKVTT